MQRGKIAILSGPSGVGKNTVLAMLINNNPSIKKISTATTRTPRSGEVEGKDHFFVSEADFKQKIKDGSILEYNVYNGNYYGTLKKPVMGILESGQLGIMEIDVNGAMALKNKIPEIITIFITAESLRVIEARLRQRGTETEETIGKRLQIAKDEMEIGKTKYDYLVINPSGHPEKAVTEIEKILIN